MKRLFALALATLALAACTGEKVEKSETSERTADGRTTVSTKVDVNGHALAFTAYAMRTPSNGQTSTAAYFTVTNTGSSADRLQSVSCACAQSAMLHKTTHENGMVGMTEADGFALPAGATLVFKPGGNHVMLTGVTGALKEGDTVDLVLTFAKAGPITLHVPVRDAPLSDDTSAAMSGMKM